MPFDLDRRTRIGSRYLANFSQSVAGFGKERVLVEIKQHVGSQIDSDFLPHHLRSEILKHTLDATRDSSDGDDLRVSQGLASRRICDWGIGIGVLRLSRGHAGDKQQQ
jgi:hypothetical protein